LSMTEPPDPKIFFVHPPTHSPVLAVELTDEQIVEAMNYWIDQLGLRDWVIDFERTRGYDLSGCLGTCSVTFSKQRATIRLLAHGDNDPAIDPMDDERILVHELLHIRFAGLQHRDWDARPDSTEWQFCVEHPIQRLALTLVELRRHASPFSWETDEHAMAQHVGEQTLRQMRATDA